MSPSLPRFVSHPLQRVLKIRRGEGKVLVLAAGYFFFLMMGYYLLRPLREAMGIAKGADNLPWLMTATLAVMFLANPAFSALVSRLPRRRFIPLTYRFFAVNLLVFFVLFKLLPAHGGTALGYVFFVWLSVYNLFVVSIFWAFMADVFNEEQGKRLFAMISSGGSIGAIAGASLTETISRGSLFGLSKHAAPSVLILAAVVLLEAAVQCASALARQFNLSDRAGGSREPGPGIFEGLQLIVRSRFLGLICVYMLLFTLMSTLLYLAQGAIVSHAFADQAARTAAFARIDFWSNVLTLVTQLLLTERLIRVFGLRPMLALLPMVSILGFGALWIWPSFAALAVFQVLRRGMHYAVDRPVREILYISLGPGEKYKSKPFIDTFVYRGGDLLGAWAPSLLAMLTLPLGAVAVGLSSVWLYGAVKLGAAHERMNPASSQIESPGSTFDLSDEPLPLDT
jgi:ATP:ADP antiporter, AAA family